MDDIVFYGKLLGVKGKQSPVFTAKVFKIGDRVFCGKPSKLKRKPQGSNANPHCEDLYSGYIIE